MNMPQFTADASLYRTNRHYESIAAVLAADNGGRVSPALVGRWSWFGWELNCNEVCTRFCGWECCKWETRCSLTFEGAPTVTNGSTRG